MNIGENKEDYPELPEWKAHLQKDKEQTVLKDIAYEDSRDYFIKEDEIALKHPTADSIIKLRDDGVVDIFASATLGIRLDPNAGTISMFGDQVNVATKKFNMITKPKGFVWNKYEFNPELYSETTTAKEQMVEGTKNVWVHSEELGWHWERQPWTIRPMVKSQSNVRYSDSMIAIMKKLNLPTD